MIDYSVDPCEYGVMRPECEVCCAADARMWAAIQATRRHHEAERRAAVRAAASHHQTTPGCVSWTIRGQA